MGEFQMVFGDGKRRCAMRSTRILDVIGPVASREAFARWLIAFGIVDRSDVPPCGDHEAAVSGTR